MQFDKNMIPEPVLDSDSSLIDLYWKAWKLAWDHVKEAEGIPVSPYMDEAFANDRIWIWDTCFMVHFCKYSPRLFPGIQSLENFYAPIHDGTDTAMKIHHLDNPPLFAWIEREYFKFTGDIARLERIFGEKEYLQKHFEFFETMTPETKLSCGICPVSLKREKHGYKWSGNPNGMDNTPRGRDDYDSIYWLDAAAQQALAAKAIMDIAKILNNEKTYQKFSEKYNELKDLINSFYWDEEDGFYYDIYIDSKEKCKVKTPASYWPLLAGVASPEQAEKMSKHILEPEIFGSEIPWATVSRNDPEYKAEGMYWRGGVWLPTAYMSSKALEKYGYCEEADNAAYRLLKHMLRTWKEYLPHTIWEAYSPEYPKPATTKDNVKICRPDFCGWSALGPISLLIENVLGFHEVDAIERKVVWRKYRSGRHGIKRFRFSDIETDIISDGSEIKVVSNAPYSLVVNGQACAVKKGENLFKQ
jgi:glycogen debranching enzyme